MFQKSSAITTTWDGAFHPSWNSEIQTTDLLFHSLKLRVCHWKLVVGRPSLPFGFWPIFRGELAVKVTIYHLFTWKRMKPTLFFLPLLSWKHGPYKWWFPIGISFSMVLFSGHVRFRGCISIQPFCYSLPYSSKHSFGFNPQKTTLTWRSIAWPPCILLLNIFQALRGFHVPTSPRNRETGWGYQTIFHSPH